MKDGYRLDLHKELADHYEHLMDQTISQYKWYRSLRGYHQEKISHPERVIVIPQKEENDPQRKRDT